MPTLLQLRRLFSSRPMGGRRTVRQRHQVPTVTVKPPAVFSPPRKRPSPFFLRPRRDGVPDILDAIQELGGIAAPAQSRHADKGDYDGFREAFTGPARVLVRRKGGLMPDLLVEALTNAGSGLGQTFRLETTSDLYDAVAAAVESRGEDKRQAARDRIDQEFFDRVLAGQKCGLNTQQLKVGDRFKVRRDNCRVTDLDPDTDELTAECEPRFGRQKLPDNSPFNPEHCRVEPKENPAGFFDAPESVSEQKSRLLREARHRETLAQREKVRELAGRRLTGRSVDTTGDLLDSTAGEAPLFALKKAFAK